MRCSAVVVDQQLGLDWQRVVAAYELHAKDVVPHVAGIDNPRNGDLFAVNAVTNRTLNIAAYGAASFELARGFALWLEYDFLRTRYEAAPTLNTNTVSLTGVLRF